MKTINLTTTPESRFIIFSDAHRGDGTGSDDFAANSLIFKCALDYYLEEGFTLIELGDAEELWEVERFQQIYITHASIYERLAAFHDSDPEKTRYVKIWGNHDSYWKDNEATLRRIFPGIVVYEAALLDGHILMLHGHQADSSISSVFASAAKFVIRKLWTFAQRMGAKDPTRAANNPGRCDKIDETLHAWATKGEIGGNMGTRSRILANSGHVPIFPRDRALFSEGPENGAQSLITTIIAGHTHRPVFENLSLTERMYLEGRMGRLREEAGNKGTRSQFLSKLGHVPLFPRSCPHFSGRKSLISDRAYYNTGSCVHPRCITGIEITPGPDGKPAFTLIKWGYAAQGAGRALTIAREVLEK